MISSSKNEQNSLLNAVLISLIIFTACVILAGTVLAKSKSKTPSAQELIYEGKAQNLNPPVNTAETDYYEIGRIRISTEKQDDGIAAVLVISPWLAYPKEDSVFYEEIARKVPVIKGILLSYFSAKTKDELLTETEEIIEKKLLDEINAQLSLGKISDIYFTDYIFLE